MMELERDPTFRMYDMYDVTKDQIRERTMEKVLIFYSSGYVFHFVTLRLFGTLTIFFIPDGLTFSTVPHNRPLRLG
jgi:hypothetical protein